MTEKTKSKDDIYTKYFNGEISNKRIYVKYFHDVIKKQRNFGIYSKITNRTSIERRGLKLVRKYSI